MEKGWKEVYMTASDYKAKIAKDILENAGMKVVILNQHDSVYATIGEYGVYVAKENVAKAVELLKELKGE